MLKNKIIAKKIRNIFILFMAIIIMLGAYHNIRRSRAENVIEVSVEVADKSNNLGKQKVTVDATETSNGVYMTNLPVSVNGNVVTKYYTSDGEEIKMNPSSDEKITLELTADEVKNKKVQLGSDYDKKTVTVDDVETVLYNKELANEVGDVIVTGYMPLKTQLDFKEIDNSSLTDIKLPTEDLVIKKAFEISVQESVVVAKAENEEQTDNQTQETEEQLVEYDSSKYGEDLTVKVKRIDETDEVVIYDFSDNKQVTEANYTTTDEMLNFLKGENNKFIYTVKQIKTSENTENNEQVADDTQDGDEIIDSGDSTTVNKPTARPNRVQQASAGSKVATLDTIWSHGESLGYGLNDAQNSNFFGLVPRGKISSITLLRSDGKDSSGNKINFDVGGAQSQAIATGGSVTLYCIPNGSTYKAYMLPGSDVGTIKFNSDSRFIFSYLGCESSCTETEVVKGFFDSSSIVDTSGITQARAMFAHIGRDGSMKTLTIGPKFTTTSIIDAQDMFYECGYMNMTTLTLSSNFKMEKATSLLGLFYRCGYNKLTSLDLSNMTAASATTMNNMFNGCGNKSMTSLKIGFNTSKVTDMSSMFANCGREKLTTFSIGSNFNTSNVTSMRTMFQRFGGQLTELNLGSNFNTSNVTNMEHMFSECGKNALQSLDLGSNFNTSNVTNMDSMFSECGENALQSLDLGDKFNTSKVTNMDSMFFGCGRKALQSLDLGSNFDTSNVIYVDSMFAGCGQYTLQSLDLGSKFDTSKVTSMNSMFWGCESITSLKLGNKFNTSNVTNMNLMFYETNNLQTLDLGDKFDTSKVTNMSSMFQGCGKNALQSLDLGDKFNTSNVIDMQEMFDSCGSQNMTTLKLGRAFKNIASTNDNFVNNTGKSGCEIYVEGDIYKDQHTFKLSSSSSTTISYTRGTLIGPDTKGPVWDDEITSTSYSSNTYKITVTVRDDTKLSSSSTLSTSNITVDVGGNRRTSGITVSAGTLSSDSKSRPFTISISNYTGGTIKVTLKAGAILDAAGNSSTAKTYSITPDVTAPTWDENYSDGKYDSSAKTYTLNLIGRDETKLNSASSSFYDGINVTKILVQLNDAAYSYSLGSSYSGTDGKSKTFPITIKGFSGGVMRVTIIIAQGALVDAAGNKSEKKQYDFTIIVDDTAPTWDDSITRGSYESNVYTFDVTGRDETQLASTPVLNTGNVTVTVNGSTVNSSYLNISNGSLQNLQKERISTIKISNFTGGKVQVTIKAGAMKDIAGNSSAQKIYSFTVDATAPKWSDNISNGSYNSSGPSYSLRLTGSDETGITQTSLTKQNVTVRLNGTATTNFSFANSGRGTINDKTITFDLTINNFTGGTVSIEISAGALKDTSGNTSVAKTYSFTKDVTPPTWDSSVTSTSYSNGTYTVNVTGRDETGLNNTSSTLSASNVKVTVNGTSVSSSNLTFSGQLASGSKSKTFSIGIKNFTGGEIKIVISTGALVDTSGNKETKGATYTINADIKPPEWGNATGKYNPDDQSYTITVTGTDDIKLNTSSSTLTTSNSTVTVGGTRVTPTITRTSSTTTSVTYTVKISNHTGGAISFKINAGALIDAQSNTSAEKTFSFAAVDATKPTWGSNISGGTYSNGSFSFSVVGSDETKLDGTKSVLSSSNFSVTTSGSAVSASDLVFGTPTTSSDGKTKTFPVTIKNFKGGQVNITIAEKALYDTTGNWSVAKTYSFYRDITPPAWKDDLQNKSYNHSTKGYYFELVGTDETELNTSSSVLTTSNVKITVGGTETKDFTLGTASTSSDSKTKTFPVTLNSYTGGEIVITVSAGALVDAANNSSAEKIYTITPDITRPVWTYQNVEYDPDPMTYSVELVGTDETALNTNVSTLISTGSSQNITVKCGTTAVTPKLEKTSTTSTQIIYKLSIENYPGGAVTITISEGALVDTSANKSEQKIITLPEKDRTKPTLRVQNNNYSDDSGQYAFELVATDETAIDTTRSNIAPNGTSKNITVTCGTTEVIPSITSRNTSDGKSIIYTVVISEYPGKTVTVSVDAGAVYDTTGNKNIATSFTLPAADIQKPQWEPTADFVYDEDNNSVNITLTATDDAGLNDSKSVLDLTKNLVIYNNGAVISSENITLGTTTISQDKLTKTFPITINNFAGGTVAISISAGALVDNSGKTSDAMAYNFTDMIKPKWYMEGNGSYNKVSKDYSIVLAARDDTEIKTVDLTTSTMTVTVDGTAVTPTITQETDEMQEKKYTITIPSYTGGTINITADAGTIVDTAGNTSVLAQFSVTPDVTPPTWKIGSTGYVNAEVSEDITIELLGTDTKMLATSNLTKQDLIVKYGDKILDYDKIDLSEVTYTNDGKGGVKYVLTLQEYTGEVVSVFLPAGTLTDQAGNTSVDTTLAIESILPLEDTDVPTVSGTRVKVDNLSQVIYITFDITDMSFDYTHHLTAEDFEVTKTYKVRNGWYGITNETVTITPTIEIVKETKLTGKKGYRYKIKLTNVDITTETLHILGRPQSNPATIKVSLNKDAMLDRLSKGNEKTLLMNQQVTFESSTTDAAISLRSAIVNNTDDDKNLTIELTVNKSNSWWGTFFFIPGTYGSTATNKKLSTDNIYDLRFDGVSVGDSSAIDITVEELTSSSTTTGGRFWWNQGTTTTTAVYRIILSNLEEALRQNLKSYKEWSGCVELDIGPSSDTIYTVRNEDEDLEGFEYKNTQDILFVDVIKPELEVKGVTINDEESDSATVNLQATDKYFSTYYTTNQTASFDKTKIYLTADGVKATEEETGVKLQWEKAKDVTETRNGEKKVIGITQSVTITGMKDNLDKKLKLVIEEGACLDNSGNPNERKEISLFSRLMSASTETAATSTFLNNPYAIQRQNVQSVEFRSSTTGLNSNCAWDVSENQDGSIMAWYDGTGPYRVYIASDGLIYANPDSSYLFSYVGYATNCTDTTVVKNLNLLNTKFATKMDAMFNYTGYRSMTGLSLGDKFDTSNVTSMNRMFDNCGYTRMGSLNLGTAFDTTKVTSMSLMFRNCGYTAMTLMELGTKFNTSKVENMASMFYYTGYTAMTTLKLGNYFYTKSATNMSQMFNYTGASAMTSLDLGPAFTKIADTNTNFATGCGKNGSVTIYVGSSIYSSTNAFKLGADIATTIAYSRGTINPKYKPDWTKVSTTVNTTDKNITIKLQGNVNTDNYTGNALKAVTNRLEIGTGDSSKITVRIDGEEASTLTKTVQTSVKGPADTVTAEIIISNFEESRVQSGKTYLEWAGNIAMQLAQGTLTDAYGNPSLAELNGKAVEIKDTTTDKNTNGTMFADFIKPKLMYEQSSAVVDKTGKTVTIIFSITDKYYASENIDDASKLSIRIDGTDVSELPSVKKTLTKSISSTGVKYTLVLSELEQDSIASGKRYLDYSGSITVTVPKDSVLDKSGNGNVTEGLGIGPQDTIVKDNATDLGEIDLVRPSWQLQSDSDKGVTFDFASKTITIPVEVTDKYFSTSTLTNNVKIIADGEEVTTDEKGTIEIDSGPRDITEPRGSNPKVLIGHSYVIKIINASVDSGQLGIRIAEGAASDTSGNLSPQKDILLLNRLKATNTETEATSGFLGSASNENETIKAIQRQNINKVVFERSISSEVYDHTAKTISDTTKAWDVSSAGDQSIVAWFVEDENTNGTYVIHIGSEGGVLANADSSYLFANIGSSENCKSTVTIANLSLLDVSTVTNMNYMFKNTGKQAMTELDLGTNFSTGSATTMVGMFQGAGYNAMTTLTLGDLFVTPKVTDMNNMFNETGYKALKSLNLSTFNTANVTDMQRMFSSTGHDSMTTLTLGSNFNTVKVTNMMGMFENCGYGSMTALNLGGAFDTGKVTNMSYMFAGAGHDSMTALTLGSSFNTVKVTDMSYMFQNTGAGVMTELTLGSNFNTSAVTNMSYMFNGTGSSSMQSLVLGGYFYTSNVTDMTSMFEACGQGSIKTIDLGPAFTKVASTNTDMLKTLNNTNVYTGTAIYSNEHALRLSLDSSTTVGFETGTIIAKYQPEWQKLTTVPDVANTALKVTLKGVVNSTNYDGYNKNITNKFANGTTTQITVTIDGESIPNSRITKTISGASSTEAESVQCNLELTGFYEGYIPSKGFMEWSGNVALTIPQGTLTDGYGNPNLAQEVKEDEVEQNATGNLFLDSIKPEIIYEFANTVINHDNQTVTVGFKVTDKYFASSSLTVEQLASQIVVKIKGDEAAASVTKEVKEVETLTETVNGQNRTVGKRYELIIKDLDKGDGITYSGPMQIIFPAGMAKDLSNNSSLGKTIVIGIDDPANDHNKEEAIVDVVKPVWSVENMKISQVNGKTQATMDLIGTDKYLDKTNSKGLTAGEIKVLVDGVDITSAATELNVQLTTAIETANGVKYTLTISDFEESYEAFIAARNADTRVYREYSGNVAISIPEGKLVDTSGNKSSDLSIDVGLIDTLKPEIVKVSSTVDTTAKTETIIFDVTDKYFGTILEGQELLSKLHVFVDEEAADSVTKEISLVKTHEEVVDGVTRTVGKRYALVLSDFEQPGLQSGYRFKGLSGTVKVTVDAGVATDSNENVSDATTLAGDFTDLIEPSVIYEFSRPASGVNSVTIAFEVTDKYYTGGDLTLEDLSLKIQNGTDLSNYIDMKTIPGAKIEFGVPTNVTNDKPMNKTVNGTVQKELTGQIIGKRYTITISNLQQAKIKDGEKYLEYSGNVQIDVAKGKVKDQGNNGNSAQTIIFGINLPEGTGAKENLDIVKPVWSVDSQVVDLDNQEATIIVTGTDKYFAGSTLTDDSIELWIDGVNVPTNGDTGKNIKIQSQEEIYEDWIENGETTRHLVGVKYTIKATGFEVDKGQVKIKIIAGTIVDLSGNTSDEIDFMLYSCLKATNTETAATSGFLGSANSTNEKVRSIQRQNIESVNFVSGISTIISSTKWDVSAGNDESIMAWYETNSNGTLKVYIGGTTAIFANPDSSYLFANIGTSSKCTATEVVKNLDIVTTKRVTNMSNMFLNTGATAMTALNLGVNFSTASVEDMSSMFNGCGINKMQTLTLGAKFDTSNVSNMQNMFASCGRYALTELNLGESFNTSNVTNMAGMFTYTGASQMTSFNIGKNFNTVNVTNMSSMFNNFGNAKLTSLDLGDMFYTTSATDMTSMFYNCGATLMTSIDLGPAFTKIAETNTNFATNFGKSGATVNAPEAIYQDSKNFRLEAESKTTVAYSRGTINPKYKTEWSVESSSVDKANGKVTINLRGRLNSGVTLAEYRGGAGGGISDREKIEVYVDGTKVDALKNSLEIKTSEQVSNSSTGRVELKQTIILNDFEETIRQSGKLYKEWSGTISLKIAKDSGLQDTYGSQNLEQNLNDIVFADFIKPELTYIYSQDDINHDAKTLTVDFSVTDKYFVSTTLSSADTVGQLTVSLLDTSVQIAEDKITKTLTKVKDVMEDRDGDGNAETKIGEKYRLVISGLEQAEIEAGDKYKNYSGPIGIDFPAGIVTDNSNNSNEGTSIVIGINEPDGTGNQEIVDVVSPVWTATNIDVEASKITLRVTDKYLIKNKSVFGLTGDKIKVISYGVESTVIGKELTGPTEIVANQEYEYTLTLTNVAPTKKEYTEFTPIDPIVGGTAKYRTENGGDLSIKIEAGAIKDAYNNSTKEQTFKMGMIDSIGPEVYDVQKSKNTTTKVETFIFNVTDRNYDETDLVTTDEMSLWMDDAQVDSKLTKTITKTVAIKTTIEGKERVVGHQYTLEVKGFEESGVDFKTSGRKYRELSGTLQVKINENAAKDKKGNTLSPETTTLTDFVDFIKPEVTYKFSAVDIDKTNKTYKMVLDIVDKYYDSTKSEALTANDLNIQVDGKDVDWTKVTKTFSPSDGEDITDTVKFMKDGTFVTESKVIGKRYTLMLSGLEQLQKREESGNYISYSGVVTVEIPEDKISDTSSNKNVGTTVTSGVDLPDGTGNGEVVDVVDPLIEMISTSADVNAQTATVTFRATDKYYASTAFTTSKVKVVVDGSEVSGVTATISSPTELKEDRIVDGTTKSVQYGVQYTVNISGFTSLAKQVKVRILADSVKDESGNGNKQTDLIVYNILRSAIGEGAPTENFLGKAIQRQDIDNITFEKVVPNSVYNHETKKITDTTRAWDVSAMGDQSIVAWYVDSEIRNGIYKVHIANNNQVPTYKEITSNDIYANPNSTALFAHIGSSSKATSTEAITNIGLLNVSNVTNMQGMFLGTGITAMTKLDLGDKFDTSNVVNMNVMFYMTGMNVMTDFDLGDKFDTSNVTTMYGMFNFTGMTAMTSLNLGDKFDTSNVTLMYEMFSGTGNTAMTSLNLRDKFNTSKVTNMHGMFNGTGYTAMTSLDLGDKFDTSKVTNMKNMFYQTGYSKMTVLDLGDKFNTKIVEDMSTMFSETGHNAMTILDLGPKFTKIAGNNTDMFKNCGTTNLTIYAPEAIYSSIQQFKTNQ